MKMILFDIDGTLIRTGGAGIRALSRAFEHCHGVANAMGLIQPAGKTDPAIIREIFHANLERNCTDAEMKQLCDTYLTFLRQEIEAAKAFRVMPGMEEILKATGSSAEWLVGLITGNLEVGARIKLERPGLFRYFRFGGYGSDSENRAELTRIGIQRGRKLQKHASSDREIFLVGDTPFDIDAGKKSGVVTIAVATGPWKLADLQSHKPDFAFQDLSDTDGFFKAIGL